MAGLVSFGGEARTWVGGGALGAAAFSAFGAAGVIGVICCFILGGTLASLTVGCFLSGVRAARSTGLRTGVSGRMGRSSGARL